MSNWYYAENGQKVGPATLEQLRQRVTVGDLRPMDMVWQEGTAGWVPVQTVPELSVQRQVEPSKAALRPCYACGGQVAEIAFVCPHCGSPQPCLVNELERIKKLDALLLGWCVPLLIVIGAFSYLRHAENPVVAVLLILIVASSSVGVVGRLIGFRYLWKALFRG